MSVKAKHSLIGSITNSTVNLSASISDRESLFGSFAKRRKLSGTISSMTPKLIGDLNARVRIHGAVSTKRSIAGKVSISSDLKYEYYKGAYDITPMIEQQVADTKGCLMEDDLIIRAIPYAEVTNSANGITVTIGG